MGCSGCSPYDKSKLNMPELAIKFFVLAIEAWMRATKYRENCGESFTLCGHSLGGYLSVHFALEFPNKIGKLCLLSPVGFPVRTDGYDEERLSRQTHLRDKLRHKVAVKFFENNWNPTNIAKVVGSYGVNRWLSSYVNERVLIATEQEKQLFKQLMA